MDLSRERYLSLVQAAAYLNRTPAALRKLIVRGVIPAWTWKRVGRSYSFLRPALDEWMEENYRAVRKGKSLAA